jgi:hypothetical protein
MMVRPKTSERLKQWPIGGGLNMSGGSDFEVLVWKKKRALTAGGTIEVLPKASGGGVLEIVVRPRNGRGAPSILWSTSGGLS